MTTNALILEIIDSATGCITGEVKFSEAEASKLLDLLDIGNPDFLGVSYDLEESDMGKIIFKLKNIPEIASTAYLRAQGVLDGLPYKIHTNRELLMMLAGEKPLAVFYDFYPSTNDSELIPTDKFEPYVINGRFIKREFILKNEQNPDKSIQWIFYALPNESWRIDAYILLKKTASICGWNNGFERMEGTLLGYTDEQNDVYQRLFCT